MISTHIRAQVEDRLNDRILSWEVAEEFNLTYNQVLHIDANRLKRKRAAHRDDPSHIASLSIADKTFNPLARDGVETIDQLVTSFSALDLLRMTGIGPSKLEDIKHALAERGLALRSFTACS